MIAPHKIIVALDTQDPEKLKALLESLKGHPVWVKIGMEVFYSFGEKAIREAKDHGFKVFLDLKLHDIPNTVGQAMKFLSRLPIDMVNVHAAGGSEMMKRAGDGIRSRATPPLLMAVTQLTSTTQEQMHSEQRISGDLLESVVNFAKLAKESGCDGVVSSPLEVQAIKLICGSKFLTVTPGIRPLGANLQDQKRVTSPMDALHLGTDFMVIGRPITESENPRSSLEKILRGE